MNFEKIRSTIRDFTKQNKSNKEPIEFIVEKINNY